MVEWHNTVTGQVTGPLVQAGRIDAVYLPGPVTLDGPPLTSWADRPELPNVLRDLLAAQQKATETLPYKLLGVRQPELTQVYVQQTMRTQSPSHDQVESGERGKPQTESGERTMAVTEALNRNGHLMITGEPGSGKSTVGYMYVQQIATYWLNTHDGEPPLTEPVLPLRIPARALANNKVWAELLAAGAEEALGRLLSARPVAELFARRALGARWLVFIDGLDEIIEPDTRAQVIDALAHQIRRGTEQRLVITTRPLAGNELKPLERAGVERYEIQPFGPVELAEFARSWFRAQNPITARTRAEEFVRQVRDSRLRELVRNPLLATITAIAKTVEPDRPLPNNRVDLYERFMAYLLDDRANRRDTLAELRKSCAGQPARVTFVEWLHEHRVELAQELAVHRLDTESPLLNAAYEWVEKNSSLPDAWQDDVRALLGSTGLFVPADGSFRFRHHSFAEFLAARRRAGEIPADFPDLDEWIARGLSGAKKVFALFTFVLWGREDHDLDHVLTTLLAGTREKVLLAGRLLAEGIVVDTELAATVIDRLLDLLMVNGVRDDPWDDVEEISDVLGSLMPTELGDGPLNWLAKLRDAPELAEAIRVESAVILGRLGDPDTATAWLVEFAESAGWAAIERVVRVLPDLVPDGAERAERVLIHLVDDHVSALAVISILHELDRTEAAQPLIRALCESLRDRPSQPLPLGQSRLVDEVSLTPTWGVVARIASRSDCHAEALWAAGLTLAQRELTSDEFGAAIEALLAAKGAAAVAEVMSSVFDRPIRHTLGAASALRKYGHVDDALTLTRQALTQRHISTPELARAATLFAQCGATPELLRLIEESPHLAQRLTRVPGTPITAEHYRSTLNSPNVSAWELRQAGQALLDPNNPATAEEVDQAARRHGAEHWGNAAIALYEAGYVEQGNGLLKDMLTRGVPSDVLISVAAAARFERRRVLNQCLPEILTAAADTRDHSMSVVVDILTRAGHAEHAGALAARFFTENVDNQWGPDLVESWLEASGVTVARDILATTLARDVPAEQRLDIADEFAFAGLREPAVIMWLDVVRYHGEAFEKGITAARSLVRSGHREQALATIDEALASKPRPAVRARLTALRAWLLA